MKNSKSTREIIIELGLIIAFGSIACYAVFSRTIHIAAFLGWIGEEKSESAILTEMHSGKNSHFTMTKFDGNKFELIPRSEHFKQYHIGDTIQARYNSILPNFAYIGNNEYLIVQSLITIAFWSFMIGFMVYRFSRSNNLEKYKSKMYSQPRDDE